MAKIASNTILILLYICFLLNSFSLVLSRQINYNYENSCAEETITEAGSLANDFQLQFNSGPNTEYIKIILIIKKLLIYAILKLILCVQKPE